jgi:hypothetical protein
MEKNVRDLISTYSNLLSSVEYHKEQFEVEQTKAREVLRLLFNEIGKEPFEVNGREVAILLRGKGAEKVYQIMPTTRVRRKPREAKEAGVAPEVASEESEAEEIVINVD